MAREFARHCFRVLGFLGGLDEFRFRLVRLGLAFGLGDLAFFVGLALDAFFTVFLSLVGVLAGFVSGLVSTGCCSGLATCPAVISVFSSFISAPVGYWFLSLIPVNDCSDIVSKYHQ